jgi:uncharacterized coiled-coil DUF342 family protein
MAKGVKRTWEILIDYIPHVYDAERELRVLGIDGAEEYKIVNQLVFDQASGKTIRVNDVTTGKYDVAVTTGPGFSTLRQEAAEIYPQLFPPDSPLYPFVADLIAQSSDLPYADKMAKRLKLAAPPAVQEMEAEGKDIPPEAQAAMAKAEQTMQQAQQYGQMVQQAAQEAGAEKAEAEKAKAAVETAIAKLGTAKAQFEAYVQKEIAKLQQKELSIQANQMQGQREIETQANANETQAVITDIQQKANDLMNKVKQEQQKLSQSVDKAIAAMMQPNPNSPG